MAKPPKPPKRQAAPTEGMDPQERVEYILNDWCLPASQVGAEPLKVSDAALEAWRERYRPKFLKAIVDKGRTWEADGQNVLIQARLIGALSAVYAYKKFHAQVEVEDALRASEELDCMDKEVRLGRGRLQLMAKWC